MPQPPKRGASWRIEADVVGTRPKLAARIGAIAGLWSYLEWQRAIFLAAMLKIEAHIAMTMYLSLESDGGKQAVLLAVLTEKFPDLVEEFKALNKKISSTSRERNNVIHGLWSASDHNPETMVWEDPRKVALVHGAAVSDIHRNILMKVGAAGPHQAAVAKVDEMFNASREYTEHDLEEIEGRIKERIEEFRQFALKVIKRADEQ